MVGIHSSLELSFCIIYTVCTRNAKAMEVDPFDRGVIFEQRRTPLKPGTTNSCNGKKEDFKKSLHALINRAVNF